MPAKRASNLDVVTKILADDRLGPPTDAFVAALNSFSPLAQRTAEKLLNDMEDPTLAIATGLKGHWDAGSEGAVAFSGITRTNTW